MRHPAVMSITGRIQWTSPASTSQGRTALPHYPPVNKRWQPKESSNNSTKDRKKHRNFVSYTIWLEQMPVGDGRRRSQTTGKITGMVLHSEISLSDPQY
jgi:hypothetical protein